MADTNHVSTQKYTPPTLLILPKPEQTAFFNQAELRASQLATRTLEDAQSTITHNVSYAAVITTEAEKEALLQLMHTVNRVAAIFFIGVTPISTDQLRTQIQPVRTYTIHDNTPDFKATVLAFINPFFGSANSWEIFVPGYTNEQTFPKFKAEILALIRDPSKVSPHFSSYTLDLDQNPKYSPMTAWTLKEEGKDLLLFIVIGAIFAFIGLNRAPSAIGIPSLI